MPTAEKINVDILTGQKLSHLSQPINDKPALSFSKSDRSHFLN